MKRQYSVVLACGVLLMALPRAGEAVAAEKGTAAYREWSKLLANRAPSRIRRAQSVLYDPRVLKAEWSIVRSRLDSSRPDWPQFILLRDDRWIMEGLFLIEGRRLALDAVKAVPRLRPIYDELVGQSFKTDSPPVEVGYPYLVSGRVRILDRAPSLNELAFTPEQWSQATSGEMDLCLLPGSLFWDPINGPPRS